MMAHKKPSPLLWPSDLEDWTKCRVCLEPFDADPKLPQGLQRGHTFCKECLYTLKEGILRENSFRQWGRCPLCRDWFRLQEEPRQNFGLMRALEASGFLGTLPNSAVAQRRSSGAAQHRNSGATAPKCLSAFICAAVRGAQSWVVALRC